MKKIIALAAIALFIISCSGDNSQTTNSSDTVLLKKLVSTDEDGNVITYNYTYDGSKLVSVIGTDGSTATYNYTNEHITYKKYVVTEYISETFTQHYDNGKIKSEIFNYIFPEHPTDNYNESKIYTYNNDGTGLIHYLKQHAENIVSEFDYTIIYSDDSLVINYENGTSYTYTYDGKNSPFKNVLGANEIAENQNLMTLIANSESAQYTFEDNVYEYNSDNYPISATIQKINIDKTYHDQYFYE